MSYKNQGMNWISRELRKRIMYGRDRGLCLICCRSYLSSDRSFGLDHVSPAAAGEKRNSSVENLATCCNNCNSSKGNLSLDDYLKREVGKGKISTSESKQIKKRIESALKTEIPENYSIQLSIWSALCMS